MVQMILLMLSFIFIMMNMCTIYFMSISYYFGCDMILNGLILLSLWIVSLMLMASESIYNYSNYINLFLIQIVLLLLFLMLIFSSMNLFMFYLFFESSLTPTLFSLLGWGYQPEHLLAGVYLLFYTVLVSLPVLIEFFFYL